MKLPPSLARTPRLPRSRQPDNVSEAATGAALMRKPKPNQTQLNEQPKMGLRQCSLFLICSLVFPAAVRAQTMTYAEVMAQGATPLSATEARALVLGSKTELRAISGHTRLWTNREDGTFVASRDNGPYQRRSARGSWSVKEDGTYCLTFDWGAADIESSCRQLYRVGEYYYAFGENPQPDWKSGRFTFSK